MAIRMLRDDKSPEAILSALMRHHGVCRRQAYRYLSRAKPPLEVLPVPEDKSVFTVNLPRKLIQHIRAYCRQQRRPISHAVAEALQQWLEWEQTHG